MNVEVVIDDGGRAAAGYRGEVGDCVTRAIAIATGLPYAEVYDELRDRIHANGAREWTKVQRKVKAWRNAPMPATYRRSPRDGVGKDVIRAYLNDHGWRWTPTMGIGTGTTVHLRADELPSGRIIVSLSKHLAAVVDGVVHDTHDPSRGGTRCVYGYWSKP